ncbi:ribonuclease H-like domain-containing protein [Tanacetum coccineum]
MSCTTTSPLPRSHVHALRDPNWNEAMLDEYNALITNGTWDLVPRPANVNVVRSMWLFKHKFNAYGSLSRYKARLVANGRNQQQGIDCDETFSPTVKPATIRNVLSLAVSRNWLIHQLDVKNAFLHGHLSETVYMHQTPSALLVMLHESVFSIVKLTPFLFVIHRGSKIAYLLLYVDDIILTASSSAFLLRIIASWYVCLYMHDPRDPHFTALKRILRYVRDTLDYGMQLMLHLLPQLSEFMISIGLLDVIVDHIGAEVEYRCVDIVVAEFLGLVICYCETSYSSIYCYLSLLRKFRVLHVPSRFQYADIFTKGLPTALFIEFRTSLNVRRSPAYTEREY